MTRKWKPGDVAMHTFGRVFAVDTPEGLRWVFDDGSGGAQATAYEQHMGSLRPLVVIDPEDREQVERLVNVLADALNWGPHNTQRDSYVAPMQAALREFANPTPPKPDEPTGLGAVVEDADGQMWVRHDRVALGDFLWHRVDGNSNGKWSGVQAVRVLSEGVTA